MRAIVAYDSDDRSARYERDMDVMHPNRHKMAEVVIDVLPFARDDALTVLDLGTGTGFLAERLLRAFPRATVIGVDGAEAMLSAARTRLAPWSHRVVLHRADFRNLLRGLPERIQARVVTSSYALHHLDRAEKRRLVATCVDLLEPGGWLINADIIVGNTERLERRYQDLRVAGILRRAGGSFNGRTTTAAVRDALDELERNEGDRPLTLHEDLTILTDAGLTHVGAFWLEFREAVTGGVKPG